MTTTGVVIASYRDLRTEKLTVVALVAQTAVEAAFGFSDGQAGTNFKIYFCKRLEPFHSAGFALAFTIGLVLHVPLAGVMHRG